MVHISSVLPNLNGQTLISGGFELELMDTLGSGAYGVVYRAVDLTSDEESIRFYAVKVLLRHADDSDMARTQEREINFHMEVSDHPNVVTLHHVIVDELYVYLILDYCGGGDLFASIMDRGTFARNDDAIRKSFVQLLDAVQACHEQGIYHRDLKPENVLCSADDEQVFLADFGLSSEEETSDMFGCGSFFYMSPECLGLLTQYAPYTLRNSDVWSLGVILSNMITGRNPWHLASIEDTGFNEFLHHGPLFLLRALPLSRSAAHLLARMLDPDPNTRITIPEARKAVLRIKKFYDPQTFQAQTEGVLPIKVAPQQEAVPSPIRVPLASEPIIRAPTTDIVVSSFSNDTEAPSPCQSLEMSQDPPPLHIASGSTSSSEESEGPPTPVTSARDPSPQIALVPDFTPTEEVHMHAKVRHRAVLMDANGSKFRRSIRRFVDVMHRVRIRS
ncbi:kinase-like protein [Panus rudis PR-1116 ss-1]|nr:kinase-like protein [Panus rudis PR-1116 ss-1]